METLQRAQFPKDFFFGAASSSYQIEGGAKEGGRGASIWDTFCQEHPDKIADRSNGDISVDSYHRYKEDVSAIEDMGMNAYRFSISWSRILPHGKISGGVNKEGVSYYNNLINELIKKGIKPFVTLFHWDLPQILEDEYGGFMSSMTVDDFVDYADVCFQEFGDRVEHWITINEPNIFSAMGYDIGCFAPGKNDEPSVYPYQVSHNQLLAHAAVVKLYREKYKDPTTGRTFGHDCEERGLYLFEGQPIQRHIAIAALSADYIGLWHMRLEPSPSMFTHLVSKQI